MLVRWKIDANELLSNRIAFFHKEFNNSYSSDPKEFSIHILFLKPKVHELCFIGNEF